VVVVHWTRQIKEVLSSQESMDTVDNSGPLEEISFWKERCEDLSGLTSQLNEPSMQRVVQIIDKAKSSYVAPFNRLAWVIQVGGWDQMHMCVGCGSLLLYVSVNKGLKQSSHSISRSHQVV